MSVALAQVIFDHVTNLPENRIVNTFHFSDPTTPVGIAGATEIYDRIAAAYTHTTAGFKILDFLGGQLAGTWRVKVYDLGATPPRVPVLDGVQTPFTPSGTALPQEVALCVSYQAIPQSGNPQARRRNRVFLGPFGVSVNAANSSDVPSRPTSNLINTALNGIAQLDVQVGSHAIDWITYSESTATFAPVHDLWIDDAWDTQRRRGEASTSRTTFILP